MCGSMTRRIEITVSEDVWGRLEAARGFEPRASFVKRALVAVLGAAPMSSSGGASGLVLEDCRFVEPLEPQGGCPECGGQWTRRVGEPGRFCVDCGGREQS